MGAKFNENCFKLIWLFRQIDSDNDDDDDAVVIDDDDEAGSDVPIKKKPSRTPTQVTIKTKYCFS